MLDSLLIPFRSQPQPPVLPEGYILDGQQTPSGGELNRLLVQCGDPQRLDERLEQALARSNWQFSVRNPSGVLVGFVRATSDLALNANLWDLSADPVDPAQAQVLLVIVHAAMARLRRELPGCSISVAAPSVALDALKRNGFVVDPGGIRAMGLRL
ncbi:MULTISPECIES: N-acetyltransferase [unclassified Synechococcus]|uniref:N-acetyltransferase n=1 Tax=unclassified Synechococcus TaxID=2626047 RepID=UPI002001CADA|nr:N-acetyltransferase [Synechococcus sp. A10-1-5-1]UPM51358.1 N-acetyltransferase [Synechococcus sp. A10-1-5-1]